MNAKYHFVFLTLMGLVLLTSWTLYTPFPDEFSDYWALRRLHFGFVGRMKLARWLDYLGIIPLGDAIPLLMPTAPARVSGVIADDFDIGNVPVRVRIPKKTNMTSTRPAFVFFHGGAYALGDRYSHDQTLSELAKKLNIIVVSVTYRLAPSAVWPAQLEDCLLVTKHLLQHGAKYAIDPTRIALGGDSAGGQLAAAVTLSLRDDKFTTLPKAQFLIYPVCQFYDFSLPSHIQHPLGPILTRDLVLYSVSNLLLGNQSIVTELQTGNHVPKNVMISARTRIRHDDIPHDQRGHPYTGPQDIRDGNPTVWAKIKDAMTSPYLNLLTGEDLSGQPPTYIFTAQYDVLRDDGYLYAQALGAAGVDVTYYNHPVGIHGMLRFARTLPEGKELYNELVMFLKKNLLTK